MNEEMFAVKTEERLWYSALTPKGDLWAETRGVKELEQEAAKWNGPGELAFYVVTQKVVTYAPEATEFNPPSLRKGI